MSRLVIPVTLLVLLGCSAAWSQTPSPPAAVAAANPIQASPWVMASSFIAAAGLIVALTFQIITLRAKEDPRDRIPLAPPVHKPSNTKDLSHSRRSTESGQFSDRRFC